MENNKRHYRLIALILICIWVFVFVYADLSYPAFAEVNYEISTILFSLYCILTSKKYRIVFWLIATFMFFNITGFTIWIDFIIKDWIAISVLTIISIITTLWHKRRDKLIA